MEMLLPFGVTSTGLWTTRELSHEIGGAMVEVGSIHSHSHRRVTPALLRLRLSAQRPYQSVNRMFSLKASASTNANKSECTT